MSRPDRLRSLLAERIRRDAGHLGWDRRQARSPSRVQQCFMSRSCVAATRLGGPDLDLISLGERYDSLVMIRAAVPDTLILADSDHGYGNAMNVQRTVRAYGQIGAAAILIEDKVTPRALTAARWRCLRTTRPATNRAGYNDAERLCPLPRHDTEPHKIVLIGTTGLDSGVRPGADPARLADPRRRLRMAGPTGVPESATHKAARPTIPAAAGHA